MPAYVPPQRRGAGGESAASPEPDPPAGNGGGGRFDKDEDPPFQAKGQGRGAGGRNQGDGTKKSIFVDNRDDASVGSWFDRPDGRRRGGEAGPTELEVFGERKARSTAGIDFDKYDNIPVAVTGEGKDDIVAISRFSEARLTDSLFENLQRCGYDRPTPIQKYSIPIVVAGRDLMACAQTGSGKTCAFMVPCLESLLRSGPPPPSGNRRPKPSPCGLVLAPTRELAAQIHAESAKFSFETGIRTCIIYGGAEMREQRMDLEKGCDILVATPGRLTDMFERGNVSLGYVHFFILDEADRMLDMGFEPQVRQIVDQTDMNRNSKLNRQSMMFSATFGKEVQIMARDFLDDYLFITVGRVGSASDLITQKVIYAEDNTQKVRAMEKALKEYMVKDGLAVIFVETKRSADTLERELHEKNVPVCAIHGDRSQSEREEALKAFKSGANPVLVATDVAARGLDIPNVCLVINFDMPKQLDDYVHRIGRTGRAGRKGTAVALLNERCAYLSELYELLTEAKQDVPQWFEELGRSVRGRAPPGGKGGRIEKSFGGVDSRYEGAAAAGAPGTRPAPSSWGAPARPSNAFGNTGQLDAWD